jgi:hypothetical protein
MKTRTKGLIVFILIGLVLLLFSTRIILLLTGHKLSKEQIDTTVLSRDIAFSVDNINKPKGILELVYFNGWAFDKTFPTSLERNISFILKADDYAYEISAKTFSLPNIAEYFADQNVTSEGLGYIGSFSTIALQDGKYELFIKYWDERHTPAIVYTGRFFVKGGGAFEEIPRQ